MYCVMGSLNIKGTPDSGDDPKNTWNRKIIKKTFLYFQDRFH